MQFETGKSSSSSINDMFRHVYMTKCRTCKKKPKRVTFLTRIFYFLLLSPFAVRESCEKVHAKNKIKRSNRYFLFMCGNPTRVVVSQTLLLEFLLVYSRLTLRISCLDEK